MRSAITSCKRAVKAFKEALVTPGLKIVPGTDAIAGAHGHNVEELIYRVQKEGRIRTRPFGRRRRYRRNRSEWKTNGPGTTLRARNFISPDLAGMRRPSLWLAAHSLVYLYYSIWQLRREWHKLIGDGCLGECRL